MRFKIFLAFLALSLFSCRSVVNPNEWVVSTGTCWNTYTVSEAGDYVPKLYTTCDRMIILPATSMSAEFEVETKFKNKVAGKVKITYMWRIAEPILFINSAKSIVSSSTDEDHKINTDALEQVENSVVDKILADIIREDLTPGMEPDINEVELEKALLKACKTKVGERGVEFSNMSMNITLSPQIEEALDIMSALRFYESAGEAVLGREVIKAKAGSANIHTK